MHHIRRPISLLLLTLLLVNALSTTLSHSGLSIVSGEGTPTSQQLLNAATYIADRFDARLGLVSEEEDAGSNVPDGTPCYRTYWVYSDNLWASRALEPYYPEMVKTINRTTALYIAAYGYGALHEVVLGIKTPMPPHAATYLKAATFFFDGTNHTIWLDMHRVRDSGIFYDANDYVDLCLYRALNNYLDENLTGAVESIRLVDKMWRAHGFYDKAAQSEGRYQNYKLGLYLFTVKATGVTSTIKDAVEKVAWSYQKTNGGIATQGYLNGTVYGTANVETTSALLLAYNPELLFNVVRKAYESMTAEYLGLQAETESLSQDFLKAQRVLQEFSSDYDRLKKESDNLKTDYEALNSSYSALTERFNLLQTSYENQTKNYEKMLKDLGALKTTASDITLDLGLVTNMMYILTAMTAALGIVIIYLSTKGQKTGESRAGPMLVRLQERRRV